VLLTYKLIVRILLLSFVRHLATAGGDVQIDFSHCSSRFCTSPFSFSKPYTPAQGFTETNMEAYIGIQNWLKCLPPAEAMDNTQSSLTPDDSVSQLGKDESILEVVAIPDDDAQGHDNVEVDGSHTSAIPPPASCLKKPKGSFIIITGPGEQLEKAKRLYQKVIARLFHA
jgi:hypothetical protein